MKEPRSRFGNQLNSALRNLPDIREEPKTSASGEEAEVAEARLSAKVHRHLYEMMEREAFWERTTMKDILNEALASRYEARSFEDIPENKRPRKRGRRPKS